MKTSQQLIEWRDRVLARPRHLREFEEVCALNSINDKIAMAQADERRIQLRVDAINLERHVYQAILACADKKPVLAALSDLYLHLIAVQLPRF